MTRLARFTLAATALFLVVACHGDRAVTPDVASPSFALSDGTRLGGNPDFFFLPPVVPNPSGNDNFDAGEFNPDLLPVVNVCELTGNPSNGPVDCKVGPLAFGPVTAQASVADEHYKVNWHTDESNGGLGLNVSGFYRIQVFVSDGGTLLGFADVDPVSSGKELKNLQTGDVFGLVDGRTLPIKFRIEESALCQPGTDTCSSETIVLANGGSVVLEETGDRVDIPAQNTGGVSGVITVTVQLCDRQEGIQVDLRKFGNCLTVTSDPPLGESRFSPAATVSMCSVFIDPDVAAELAALGAQEDLVTMHRQDDGDIFALPHGGQFCGEPIGSRPSNLFQQLARSLGSLFAPRPLHAATAVLDVGPSGETDFFSDFQLALPAQMFPAEGTDEISGPPGGEASPVPAVVMMDAGDPRSETPPQPVAGALVTFRVTGGGNFGTDEGAITEIQVLSDANGRAEVPMWVLGDGEGTNTVTASGRGFAGPDDDGPFMPDISLPTVCENEEPCQQAVQLPDPLDARTIEFTATIVAEIQLIDCPPNLTSGGDDIDRGFYVTSFPGNRLSSVELFLSARPIPPTEDASGSYTLSLTARNDSYDGTVLGSSTAIVTLSGTSPENRTATFTFDPAIDITSGSRVTFAIMQVGGPAGTQVLYNVGSCGFSVECTPPPSCPVIETESTTPPLSTFRRNGIGVRMFGTNDQ